MSREVYLVRHAHCEKSGTLLGQADVHLTPKGLVQAEVLARWFADRNVERIVASDLKRAIQTAHRIAAPLGLKVEPDARLREITYGSWDGRFWDDIARMDPEAARLWQPPGGESFDAFVARVRAAWESIRRHPAQVTVVVAHRGVNGVLFGDPLGFEQDYAAALKIEVP